MRYSIDKEKELDVRSAVAYAIESKQLGGWRSVGRWVGARSADWLCPAVQPLRLHGPLPMELLFFPAFLILNSFKIFVSFSFYPGPFLILFIYQSYSL